jgi:hypothetical protein
MDREEEMNTAKLAAMAALGLQPSSWRGVSACNAGSRPDRWRRSYRHKEHPALALGLLLGVPGLTKADTSFTFDRRARLDQNCGKWG